MANVRKDSYDPRNRPAERKMISLARVQIDRSTQARMKKDPNHVQLLVEVLESGKEFKDDPEVYFDGKDYWIGDGFHRLEAYARVGRERVYVLVREGGRHDAILHAVGANAEHGMPRTRKDVRRAIRLALEDP